MKKFAIIVAGGSGTRMESSIPKQFLQLGEKPVLFHTLEQFAFSKDIELILVLPKNQLKNWEELCMRYEFPIEHTVVEGGETRFHSVKNGLQQISEDGLVAVHDGVRPLVSKDLIRQAFEAAAEFGNAVPALPVNESMRTVSGDKNFFTDRSKYRNIQTPQCFRIPVLQKAFEQEYVTHFTDEATVAEADGSNIHLIPGETRNIKITSQDDLVFAEALLKNNSL